MIETHPFSPACSRRIGPMLGLTALIALTGCGQPTSTPISPAPPPGAPSGIEVSPEPPAAEPTPALSSYAPPTLAPGSLRFTDTVAGISLDYPAGWNLIEPTDEAKAESTVYSTTFHSWAPDQGGQSGVPAGGTKFDLTVVKEEAQSLEAFAAAHPEWAPGGAEGIVTLPSGVRALRVELAEGQAMAGPAVTWLAVVGGQPVLLSGIGDLALVDAIAGTLRPGGD